MTLAIILIFAGGCFWLWATKPEQRMTLLGYLIAFAVISSIISLITGQGPNSAY